MFGFTLLLLAVAADDPPAPRTVNSIVLGQPEEFAFHGPGRVCMSVIGFDLSDGETAYLVYSGIHHAQIRIVGPRGFLDLREGIVYLPPHGRRSIFLELPRLTIARYHRRPARYALETATVWPSGRGEGLGNAAGSALSGGSSDRVLLSRIARADGSGGARCRRRYNYGWSVIFGDEQLIDDLEP